MLNLSKRARIEDDDLENKFIQDRLKEHSRSVQHIKNGIKKIMQMAVPMEFVKKYHSTPLEYFFKNPKNYCQSKTVCGDCEIDLKSNEILARHLISKIHISTLEDQRKLPKGMLYFMEKMGINFKNLDARCSETTYESLLQRLTGICHTIDDSNNEKNNKEFRESVEIFIEKNFSCFSNK